MLSKRAVLAVLLLFATASAPPPAAAAGSRPVVVELFTSEGCSSCPPAESYLNDLTTQANVLPLAFHVTYWDRLGWRDLYSLQAATDRQARYGERFGDGSYTPEMVVDGHKAFVGSSRGEGAEAIRQAAADPGTAASLTLVRGPGGFAVTVGAGSGEGRLILVGFDRERRTAVRRGENAGRTITESNVVRSVRDIGRWSGAALAIEVPPAEGEDAAVLLEAADGRIIGAARLGAGA